MSILRLPSSSHERNKSETGTEVRLSASRRANLMNSGVSTVPEPSVLQSQVRAGMPILVSGCAVGAPWDHRRARAGNTEGHNDALE